MALTRRGFFRRAISGTVVAAAVPIVGPSILTGSLGTGSPYRIAYAPPFSEYLMQTSFYDQMASASSLLGRDMANVLDETLRDHILEAA